MGASVFKDNFALTAEHSYPTDFLLEQVCETPHMLGEVIDHQFCIMDVGNRHIPIMPDLRDFKLRFSTNSERFYSTMGLEIFFRYDNVNQEGWRLCYNWGVFGKKNHQQQIETPEYECSLVRFYGKRSFDKCEVVANNKASGFITDLSQQQTMELTVNSNQLTFTHQGSNIASFIIPDGYSECGKIAFDKSHSIKGKHGVHRLFNLNVETDIDVCEKIIRSETRTEFPAEINGIISPYYFHVEIIDRNGINILRSKLTGGPAKEYVKDVNRFRFNEKMYNPYIRIEDGCGKNLGLYYLADGSVGLSEYNWNIACSVMLPADFECPLKQDFVLRNLPKDAKIYIGYNHYIAEDSITNAGGAAEALIDASGKVLWCGPRLKYGDVNFKIISPADKQICQRIPKDIPRYKDALIFAENNHFFIEDEPVKFKVKVESRDASLSEIRALITVEDVFGKFLDCMKIPFESSEDFPPIPNAQKIATAFFDLKPLEVGVYHIKGKIIGAALPEKKYAFEVMPKNPKSLCAPLASGLPKLWPNILSGVCNEHFHPWSHATVNTMHYNSGGNNYFKVADDWRVPELLHAYGREWLCYFAGNVRKHAELEKNQYLIKQSDHSSIHQPWRPDTWGGCYYRNPFLFELLLQFLQSDKFIEVDGGILNYKKLSKSSPRALSREEFLELFKHNWKKWLLFLTEHNTKLLKEKSQQIKNINPDCKTFSFCPVYPTYGSNYKSGYFPFLFGVDLRDDFARYYPGANGFEDYPYSSGYPIAKGIYNLASCKLEAPDLPLHPEVFAINGETLDHRVIFANPPLGQSDPPFGFLIKQFYEYSFATVWFDENGFNYWQDHGYHPKTWDSENYQEMLYAYSFISKVTPAKPLRTSAFVFSRDACLAHPDYYDCDEEFFNEGSVVNTAEEAVAFAYEEARADGQQAGYVMKLEDIESLNSEDVDMLVLPPLCGIDDNYKKVVRKLHSQGVALFGFENVDGLEDLFGIKKAPEISVRQIVPGTHTAAAMLKGKREDTEHELCVSCHALAGAKTLLETPDGQPVLTLHNKTAFYTIPPTFIKRSKSLVASYGQRNNSKLVADATRLAMRQIGNKDVETSTGSLIAFRDTENNVHIIVSEDKNPDKSFPIRPLVEIRIKNLKAEDIESDKEFEIVSLDSDKVRLRFNLKIAESARILCRS